MSKKTPSQPDAADRPADEAGATNNPYPLAVGLHEIADVLAPRLFLVSSVIRSAAEDQVGDLCPWNDDRRRSDFLTGLANTIEDVLAILEQSHDRACDVAGGAQ